MPVAPSPNPDRPIAPASSTLNEQRAEALHIRPAA